MKNWKTFNDFFFMFNEDWISREETRSRRVRCLIKIIHFICLVILTTTKSTAIMMMMRDKKHETCDDRFEVVNRHYDRFASFQIRMMS